MHRKVGGGLLVSSKQRGLLLAFLASASLSLCGATAARADASIVIDTSTPLSASGGNDLATLQNIFQGANTPQEPGIEPARTLLKQIMIDLKMKRVRLLQSDNLCDLDASGDLGSVTITGADANGAYTFSPVAQGYGGGCDLLNWSLPWALDNNLSPHVAVGSFMPPSFISSGPASTWPTTNSQSLQDVCGEAGAGHPHQGV